jgi:hypothetical protein
MAQPNPIRLFLRIRHRQHCDADDPTHCIAELLHV